VRFLRQRFCCTLTDRMRTVVCVKQIADPTTIRFNIETRALDNVHHIMDPLDEVAISEAMRIRGKNGGEVVAVSVGPPQAESVLRTALRMGADEAIHVCDELCDHLDAHSVSVILARLISGLQYDLILCGRESSDEGNSFLGAGLAEFLDLPLVTSSTRIDIFADTRTAIVHRRVKGGDREIIESPLPAVFTVESVLCKPTYPPLRTILAGDKRQIRELDLKALKLDLKDIEPTVAILGISQPKPRLKKTATIDSSLSPAERIRLITAGGAQQKSSKIVEKLPKAAVADIIRFLVDNGLISTQK